jgi:hypothetical protein
MEEAKEIWVRLTANNNEKNTLAILAIVKEELGHDAKISEITESQKDILQTKSNARGDVTVSVRDDIAASWGAAASNKFITNTVGAGNPAIYGAGRTNLDGSITSFNIPFNSTGAKKDSSPQSTYYAPVSAKLPTVNSLSTQYSSLQKTASNFSPVSSGGWQSKLPTPAGNTTTVKKYMTPLPTSSGGGGFR